MFCFSLRTKDPQRRPSVSSVASIDKKVNRVYEKWPDYNQISDIVGYRIDPPVSKTLSPTVTSDKLSQQKSNKSAGVSTSFKRVKNVIGLNPLLARRQSSKNKKTNKSEIIPIIIDPPPPPPPMTAKPPVKDNRPKLPTLLCPSSTAYSSRIQTRQWLIRNHFSSNATRTLPLL